MIVFRKHILAFALLIISVSCLAQFDSAYVCRVENGKITYVLDMKWTDAQKRSINRNFNLDSSVWQKIKANTDEIILDSVMWKVKRLRPSVVELSKTIENKPIQHLNEFDVFLTDNNWKVPPGYVDQEKVIYGFNSFTSLQCFTYAKGVAQIFLPGFKRSSRVYIAGSFNKWDPKKTTMQFVDSGWLVKLSLPAGKYLYKFIADGDWMVDPNNKLSEDDGQGNINSVLYCPNYRFSLKGYANARKVAVAGTFNNWNQNELRMGRTSSGWALRMYLKDGTYPYKFLVDGEWITDPENDAERPDSKGNPSSVVAKGGEYVFNLKGFTHSKEVFLAGTFNKWAPRELRMNRTSDGWQLPYKLAPGNYEYKFIVDGRWMPDPSNGYTTGRGDLTNSCLTMKPNYTFSLNDYIRAREVIVTGSFNDWNTEGYRMVKQNGRWTFPIYLSSGKHLYKYIVDGKWILDPTNKLWEENEFGTGNSVLWMK